MGQASSLSGMLQQLALSLGVAIGGYSLEIFGALADRPATDAAEFLLGVRRRRSDLGELGVVGVAAAAQRRRRDGGAHARGARSRRSQHRGAAGGLSAGAQESELFLRASARSQFVDLVELCPTVGQCEEHGLADYLAEGGRAARNSRPFEK